MAEDDVEEKPGVGNLAAEFQNLTTSMADAKAMFLEDVDRLSFVGQLVLLSNLDVPVAAEISFERLLKTKEEPYCRTRVTVGEEWTPVDMGWVKSPGMVVIKNRETKFGVVPTPEQKEEAAGKVVELSFLPEGPAHIIIYPKETQPLSVARDGLWMRCRHGTTTCSLEVFSN